MEDLIYPILIRERPVHLSYIYRDTLINNNICISMDTGGDDIFMECIWKPSNIMKHIWKNMNRLHHARRGLEKFFERYNARWPHKGLDDRTQDDVYWGALLKEKEAVWCRAANHLKTIWNCLKELDRHWYIPIYRSTKSYTILLTIRFRTSWYCW